MRKLILKVDNINKEKIVTKTYKNKDGEEVETKEYPIVLWDLKEAKMLKETTDYTFMKVGFATEEQTKEEREAEIEKVGIGDIVEFELKQN